MPITPTKHIWMNGELVPWEDAKIHVLSHSLHYGTGVFEGMRAYATDDGPAVFRLTDHIQRLYNSAKILNMPMPYSVPEIVEACKLVVRDSGLPECYVRPIAYYGYGEIGLSTAACVTDIAIAVWPWGAYLGDDALTKGVRLKVSSWARHDHNIMPPASKTTGNYANSTLAKMEALRAGYDEAIMLNPAGLVSECSGENIFAGAAEVRVTPPLSSGAARDHPALGDHHRPRHRHRRGDRRPGPQRPVHRAGDLRLRNRGRGERGQLGGRPVPGVPRPPHSGHRGGLCGPGAGPQRPLQDVERACP